MSNKFLLFMWKVVVCSALLSLLSACNATGQGVTPTVNSIAMGIDQPKRIATVFMSPTPNEADQQATRFAVTPTTNPFASRTPTSTPTVYVGFFLGDSAQGDPIIASGQFGSNLTPTAVPSRCSIATDTTVLGENWQANPAIVRSLGCPIEGFFPFSGAVQVFENGATHKYSILSKRD